MHVLGITIAAQNGTHLQALMSCINKQTHLPYLMRYMALKNSQICSSSPACVAPSLAPLHKMIHCLYRQGHGISSHSRGDFGGGLVLKLELLEAGSQLDIVPALNVFHGLRKRRGAQIVTYPHLLCLFDWTARGLNCNCCR